jgi:hypothetical protein
LLQAKFDLVLVNISIIAKLLTLLKNSAEMNRNSLSKSVPVFGLMAMLSVMAITALPQSVQAQGKIQAKMACVPLPGGGFFVEFQGIKFSPQQEVAFRKISASMGAKGAALIKRVRTELFPDASLEIVMKNGLRSDNDKIGIEILKATDAMFRDKVPIANQVEELTKKYGQSATFSSSRRLVFISKQLAEKDRITRDFEAQILSILTPEQQQIYRANLATKRGFDACNKSKVEA